MQKQEIERYAFLYLCGTEDEERLTGRREMTFDDFERLTYLAQCLGFLELELEIWREYAGVFEEEFGEDAGFAKRMSVWEAEGKDPLVEEVMEQRRQWIEEFCQNSKCEEIAGWFADYL